MATKPDPQSEKVAMRRSMSTDVQPGSAALGATERRPSEPSGGPPRRGGGLLGRVLPPLLLFALLIGAWELAVVIFDVSEFTLAKPSATVESLWEGRSLLLDATWVTSKEILLGFGASIVVGVGLALALGRFELVDRAAYPLVVLFQTIPKVALAPIFVLWFGYALGPKVLLIVVIAFFPITLNMRAGLAAVDPDLVLLMRSVGATRNQILLRAQLPTSLPYLFAGLRIGVTFSVIGAVVAEFAGANEGLGYLITYESTQLNTPRVFAALLVISVVGLVFYYAISLLEWIAGKFVPTLEGEAVLR